MIMYENRILLVMKSIGCKFKLINLSRSPIQRIQKNKKSFFWYLLLVFEFDFLKPDKNYHFYYSEVVVIFSTQVSKVEFVHLKIFFYIIYSSNIYMIINIFEIFGKILSLHSHKCAWKNFFFFFCIQNSLKSRGGGTKRVFFFF